MTIPLDAAAATHIVTILTPDRRGIIHRLVERLGREDVPHVGISQTVVHGAFTVALVLVLPPGAEVRALAARLADAAGQGASASTLAIEDLASATESADGERPAGGGRGRYILTAIGPAVAGVVRDLTRAVLEHGGNFTDFSSNVEANRLQLVAEVELPEDVRLDELQAALGRAGSAPGLAVRLQHERLFAATNEIAFGRAGR